MTICSGVNAGVPALACLSAQNGYIPGYAILFVVSVVVLLRLGREPAKEQLAVGLYIISIVALLMAVIGFIPSRAWEVAVVLAVGASVLLVIRS